MTLSSEPDIQMLVYECLRVARKGSYFISRLGLPQHRNDRNKKYRPKFDDDADGNCKALYGEVCRKTDELISTYVTRDAVKEAATTDHEELLESLTRPLISRFGPVIWSAWGPYVTRIRQPEYPRILSYKNREDCNRIMVYVYGWIVTRALNKIANAESALRRTSKKATKNGSQGRSKRRVSRTGNNDDEFVDEDEDEDDDSVTSVTDSEGDESVTQQHDWNGNAAQPSLSSDTATSELSACDDGCSWVGRRSKRKNSSPTRPKYSNDKRPRTTNTELSSQSARVEKQQRKAKEKSVQSASQSIFRRDFSSASGSVRVTNVNDNASGLRRTSLRSSKTGISTAPVESSKPTAHNGNRKASRSSQTTPRSAEQAQDPVVMRSPQVVPHVSWSLEVTLCLTPQSQDLEDLRQCLTPDLLDVLHGRLEQPDTLSLSNTIEMITSIWKADGLRNLDLYDGSLREYRADLNLWLEWLTGVLNFCSSTGFSGNATTRKTFINNMVERPSPEVMSDFMKTRASMAKWRREPDADVEKFSRHLASVLFNAASWADLYDLKGLEETVAKFNKELLSWFN